MFDELKELKYFKGYLRYKMIISQNVSSEAQIKNFLFRRKIIFCSQDIQVFAFFSHPMIYRTCDITISIST